MDVFVTGATGFIGLHTVLALQAAGHSVRLGVRNREKMIGLYAKHGMTINDYVVGDITDERMLSRGLDGCDAVVHTAALVSTDPAHSALMRHTNVKGTEIVINEALQQGIKSIVYVSSAAALFDPGLSSINEDTPIADATSPYAQSKADADRLVRRMVAEGASIAITYPTGVMGPDDPAISEGNQSLLFILRNFHVNTSSGLQIIDVRDLASVQVKLLEGAHRGGFIVGGHYCPWRELGAILEALTARRLLKLPLPGPLLRGIGSLVDQLNRVTTIDTPITREAMEFATRWVQCDDRKLRETLSLEYRPLQDTLRDTALWFSAQGHINAQITRNMARPY